MAEGLGSRQRVEGVVSRTLLPLEDARRHIQFRSIGRASFEDIDGGSEACRAPRKSWAEPRPWPQDRLRKWIGIQGNSPAPELWLHFPLPDLRKDYKSNPLAYVNYVLSYGGEHGLTDVLVDKLGLVTGFGMTGMGGSAGYDAFVVVKLTDKGRAHYELVLDVLFQYLGTLRAAGVDMELYQSLSDVSHLEWDWSEPRRPSDAVSELAEGLLQLPAEDLLTGGGRIEKLDDKLVKQLFDLMKPDNMNLALVDPKANDTFFAGNDVKHLPFYNATFVVDDINIQLPGATQRWKGWLDEPSGSQVSDSELRQRLKAAQVVEGDVVLPVAPKAIKGVPKTLDTTHMKAAAADSTDDVAKMFGEHPQQLASQVQGADSPQDLAPEIWYRSGWVSKSPKMTIRMELTAPRKNDSFEVGPEDALSLQLYSSLLGEEMNPKMYDLSMTGVAYSLGFHTHAVTLSFGGFAPVMPELVSRVLSEFDRGVNTTDPSRFQRLADEMKQGLATFSDMPITYAIDDRNLLLTQGAASREEQQAALATLTPESVAAAVERLVMPLPMQAKVLAMGNVDEEQVDSVYNQVMTRTLKWTGANKKPAADEKIRLVSPVVRPSQPIELRRLNARQGDPNDVLVVSVLAGVSTVETRVLHGLLSSMLRTVAYSELRTNRQLGYVVSAGISAMGNVQYVSCVIQGAKLNADKMEGAAEFVLGHLFPKSLRNMTAEEFESHKASLKEQLLQPPSTYMDEFSFFLSPIVEGGNCFGLRSEMLKYLESSVVTKDLLLRTWEEIMAPKEGVRQKILIKHFANSVPGRPTDEQATAIWKESGIEDPAILSMLQKERTAALLLDKADSSERKKIVAAGSFFPPELHCTRANTTSTAVASLRQDKDQGSSPSSSGQFIRRVDAGGRPKSRSWSGAVAPAALLEVAVEHDGMQRLAVPRRQRQRGTNPLQPDPPATSLKASPGGDMKEAALPAEEVESRRLQDLVSWSQFGQDRWVVSKHPEAGFFVDIGARHGSSGSNSYALESQRQWRGLCVEPMPGDFSFRTCKLLKVGVSDHDGKATFKKCSDPQLSGLQEDAKVVHAGCEDVSVDVRSIRTLVEENLPADVNIIDYVNLDIEGGELKVLQDWPFDRACVKLWTIEHNNLQNKVPIQNFLEGRGCSLRDEKVDWWVQCTCN
eukprot:TRINITY_DN4481_c0_g1_i1.p1 TRINITY_DN4481_c0_g1~~TRINITY_DN4481_c0_g1_i1.p1  ORF type:complete len:1167 (+),score=267.05 TRINITY_DN4481_c0_g1_i1:946-4446(+)